MEIWKAKIDENNLFQHETVKVKANEWIDVPPYAIQQNVMIQDLQDNVFFGWVECCVRLDENGIYKVVGLQGGYGCKPLKYYMIIPFPFDDRADWNFTFNEEDERVPKENKQYIVALEVKEGTRTTYKLALAYYKPGKYSDWLGYDFKDCSKTIIAWREIPRPKKGIKSVIT